MLLFLYIVLSHGQTMRHIFLVVLGLFLTFSISLVANFDLPDFSKWEKAEGKVAVEINGIQSPVTARNHARIFYDPILGKISERVLVIFNESGDEWLAFHVRYEEPYNANVSSASKLYRRIYEFKGGKWQMVKDLTGNKKYIQDTQEFLYSEYRLIISLVV